MPSVQALSANGPTMFAENYCYRLKCCALQAEHNITLVRSA